jgi:hypothetical protein
MKMTDNKAKRGRMNNQTNAINTLAITITGYANPKKANGQKTAGLINGAM